MIQQTPIIITPGQLYLHSDLNEYLIVTKSVRGQISYAMPSVKGHAEVESFLNRFQPVDPADVSETEIQKLLDFCPAGTTAKTGFILEDHDV